ncbi:hypothetical protein ACHAPQ_009047 [Fusarium lateritium]
MRSIFLTSLSLLAVSVNAGPCKPFSSESQAVQITTAVTTAATSAETTTPTAVQSSVTLQVTDTTTAEATTEATTTVVGTTTTAEDSGPLETFAAIAFSNAIAGAPLGGIVAEESKIGFNNPSSAVQPLSLIIEPVTNRLKLSSGWYLCAGWNGPTGPDQPGVVQVCSFDYSGHEYITCTQSNDRQLSCTAKEEACEDDGHGIDWYCSWTDRDITQFLVRKDNGVDGLYLGYGAVDGYSTVSLKTGELE